MPLQPFTVDLGAAGVTQLVPPGNRINAVNVTSLTAGATARIKLGNNPEFVIASAGVAKLGDGAIPNDAKQGVQIVNPTAQAGATVQGFVSYTRPGDEPRDAAPAARAIVFES